MALRHLLASSLLLAFSFAGCSGDSGGASDAEVAIHNNQFDPRTLTVAKGTEIHFENHDAVRHTATANDGTFDTGDIASGGDGHATINKAGTFAFKCKYHASMTGTITVT